MVEMRQHGRDQHHAGPRREFPWANVRDWPTGLAEDQSAPKGDGRLNEQEGCVRAGKHSGRH
jgi:hypothetical protein